MKRLLIAVTVAFCALAATSAEAGDRGEQLFQLCAQCHGTDASGNQTFGAPSIAGLPSWYLTRQLENFKSGLRGTHPSDMMGMRMRPMALTLRSEQDVADVVAHITKLPAVKPVASLSGGDPSKGMVHFNTCLACHGPDAAGNEQLGAPPLNHASDWYIFSQLRSFRAGVRGTNPKDATGLLMRPMALTLPDEQAMKDVIAYIMTLSESKSASRVSKSESH